MSNLGLYIHIPFCSSKCDYCDFVSFCMGESEQVNYLNALLKEIDLRANEFKGKVFDTIFIGGGTPSIVFNGFISKLMNKIYKSFTFSKEFEFTIEVNPSSLTEEKLNEYILSGVNRISMGVQTLDENLLKLISRKQTRSDIERAFDILKSKKFNNINADVILGLPTQTLESVKETIDYLVKNQVKHISVYTLQIEENTPLYNKIQSKILSALDDDTVAEMYSKVYKELKRANYVRYELSNFAKSGYECKHNIKYWDNSEYLGLGLSSHSYINGVRFWNTRNFKQYLEKIMTNNLATEDAETLDFNTKRTERIMLSLRRREGIDLTAFKNEFNEDLLTSCFKQIENLRKLNMIEIKDNHIVVKESKFELLNSIILQFLK